MGSIKIVLKKFKKERQCYMCGMKIKQVVLILTPLHGFILCEDCIEELKEALEELEEL